jgi:hypothetical protein
VRRVRNITMDYQGLIKRLVENEVQFIIIGGFAAVLHGSSVMTEDLDLCVSFKKNNIEHLLKAFKDIHPEHRLIGKTRPVDESAERLSAYKNLYLKTDLGYIDLLSELPGIGEYEEIIEHTIIISLFDMNCRVLDIETLIKAKKGMKRSKDKETIVQLKAIRERKNK